jgi:hypothetical protein
MNDFKIGQTVIIKNTINFPFIITGFYLEGVMISKPAEFIVIAQKNNPLASTTVHYSLLEPAATQNPGAIDI